MLEIRKKEIELIYPDIYGGYYPDKWGLFHNEEEIKNVLIDNRRKLIHALNYESSKKLVEFTPEEFPEKTQLKLEKLDEFDCFTFSIGIVEFNASNNEDNIRCSLIAQLPQWNNFYTFEQYKVIFLEISKKYGYKIGYTKELIKESLDLISLHSFTNEPIKNDINTYIEIFKNLHLETLKAIDELGLINSVNASFTFPEELKVPCEQYLLYFAQFLKDLGINVTPNLREEAGKVLFSVTPTDDIEALDKIREALEVYLRLPSSSVTSNSQEIAIQRLEIQVENCRLQIRLAKAELQLKEATIQQQQISIMKLGENVMIDSMVKPVSEKKKSEKIVKGVEVGKVEELEKYGVIIDLGELFRTMKDWFKKKN